MPKAKAAASPVVGPIVPSGRATRERTFPERRKHPEKFLH